MKVEISLLVNEVKHNDEVDTRVLLVDYLRDGLGLKGAHIGCLTGNCGACTIIMNGATVKSCTILAVQAHDAEITTIEGLAKGETLHPLQQAFSDNLAAQCGYCTPGMILSACDLLQKNMKPTMDEIKRGISGNLCRCTGYQNILQAIMQASLILAEQE